MSNRLVAGIQFLVWIALAVTLTPAVHAADSSLKAAGAVLYAQHCAKCHGAEGSMGINSVGPNLLRSDRVCRAIRDEQVRAHCMEDGDAFFVKSVMEGKMRVGVVHMPAWRGVLSSTEVQNIRDYLLVLTDRQPSAKTISTSGKNP